MQITNKFPSKQTFILPRGEKLIAIINASFEGFGIAGIITAALWYATAPMAPDGFKGPISTLIIASSTIISLLMTLPIAFIAYKKFVRDIEDFYSGFSLESQRFDNNLEEIYFDLLRLRAYYRSDDEFLISLKPLIKFSQIKLAGLHACKIYATYKHTHYFIKWDSHATLSLIPYENRNVINLKSFTQLLKDNELANIKAFRKALITRISYLTTDNRFERNIKSKTSYLKNLVYAAVAGATCTEVLLSIGWTLASILIGMKIIHPITNLNWVIYIALCALIGPLFGFGIYYSKVNQNNRDLLKNDILFQNNTLTVMRDNVNIILMQKILDEKNKLLSAFNLNSKIIFAHSN